MAVRTITIVGGGLAGLALGIALRQRGVPTVVREAGAYPRHKVCGEFISGEGLQILSRLGLMEKVLAHGGRTTSTAMFCSHAAKIRRDLPAPALCISRFQLDSLLAEEFRSLGGVLEDHSRWTEPFGESIVRATGRMPQPVVDGWRWFGLKVHALDVTPESDLEMHFTPRGYVGICRLTDKRVNVCGLFRSKTSIPDLNKNWMQWLKGEPGSVLEGRLRGGRFDEGSFCSIAALKTNGFLERTNELRIGDSLGMIPPITGNGMSLAFESAEAAAVILEQYATESMGWEQAMEKIHREFRRRFARRLRCADLLHRVLFAASLRKPLFSMMSHSDTLWKIFFAVTR